MSSTADDDDDDDWEEVHVPQRHLEITIKPSPQKVKSTRHADRRVRIVSHQLHTVSLLANASIRNTWINDTLLHARLLSLTPLELQNPFNKIQKSRIPDKNMRGRMFEYAITNLVEWWANSFFEVLPYGHIKNRTFESVRMRIAALDMTSSDSKVLWDYDTLQHILDDDGELIKGPQSLMKHVLMQSGSRDLSSQLFTALCRALGIPTRLLVSLQSVPWKAGVGKSTEEKGSSNASGKETANNDDKDNEDAMQDITIASSFESVGPSSFPGQGKRLDGDPMKSAKAKGKEKAQPVIKLRKTKAKGRTLGRRTSPAFNVPDVITTPPVFWTEVFSRPDARWFPVDPVRALVNKRTVFDPAPAPVISQSRVRAAFESRTAAPANVSKSKNNDNRMVYVVALEEDGYGRDVTRRYARNFSTKVAKMQGGSKLGGMKIRQAWWERVMGSITRPYRLNRDDQEDLELEATQQMEGMPTLLSGFKDHPIYVLTRHLRQNEALYPAPPELAEIGTFRGESVYPRSAVVSLKTAENWMRSEGRVVRPGCQPLKMVKMRAGTLGRQRELEVLRDELQDAGTSQTQDVLQGMYMHSQTQPYVAEPVLDGKIPKNNFGNIDLYVPSMLPYGAVHVRYKGVAKIARKLGFDFAEAVTGFEFKKRRAYPIIEGVVVAVENETILLEAYREAEAEAQEKARVKREERVLKRWIRLVQGLRIHQRLQDQYGNDPIRKHDTQRADSVDVVADGRGREDFMEAESSERLWGGDGGFLAGADDVVEAFHLPRYQRSMVPDTSEAHADLDLETDEKDLGEGQETHSQVFELGTMDVDEMDVEEASHFVSRGVPKTMAELATDAARLRKATNEKDCRLGVEELDIVVGTSRLAASTSEKMEGGKVQPGRSVKPRQPVRKRRKKNGGKKEDGSDESAEQQGRGEVASTPSRILRRRKGKSAAQLEEERLAEEAFRQAVDE